MTRTSFFVLNVRTSRNLYKLLFQLIFFSFSKSDTLKVLSRENTVKTAKLFPPIQVHIENRFCGEPCKIYMNLRYGNRGDIKKKHDLKKHSDSISIFSAKKINFRLSF